MWDEGGILQSYVVSIRAGFTFEASLLCLLVATAGLNYLCGLCTGQVLTFSRGLLLVHPRTANVQAVEHDLSASESGKQTEL